MIFKEEENAYNTTIDDTASCVEQLDEDIHFLTYNSDSNLVDSTEDEISPGGEKSTYLKYEVIAVITS